MDLDTDTRPVFPGMDPYLESPGVWPDFHDALAGRIRAQLNDRLPRPYYARLQSRPELGVVLESGAERRIVPDVTVVRKESAEGEASTSTAVDTPRTALSEGVRVRVRTDPLEHRFVEIRDASRGHRLVTLIEIVSPSNKRPGPDRRSYEENQREVLESPAHLVEIDLLRAGRRLLPYPELEAVADGLSCEYLVLVNDSRERRDAWVDDTLFPAGIREALPCIPVPLCDDAEAVPLDVQAAAREAYVEGPYRRMIDYSAAPEPELAAEHHEWAGELLRVAGVGER